MGDIFIYLLTQHLVGAVVIFPLVWLVMRLGSRQKVGGVGTLWFFVGLFATAVGATVIRFATMFVVGPDDMMNPDSGLQLFFSLGLPVLVALGVYAIIQTRMNPGSGPTVAAETKYFDIAKLEVKLAKHKPELLAEAHRLCGDTNPTRINEKYIELRERQLRDRDITQDEHTGAATSALPDKPATTAHGQSRSGTTEKPINQKHVSSGTKDRAANYFVRHWRGELSLAVSYWINIILLGIVATGLVAALEARVSAGNMSINWIRFAFSLVAASVLLYIWQFVGCWRSASYHKIRGKSPGWGTVAQVMLVIGLVSVLTQWHQRSPAFLEMAKISVGIDELSDYQITVLEGGDEVEIQGYMGFGIRDDVQRLLSKHESVWIIHLNSPGGRLAPARDLRDLIELREISTYTATECNSACTIAFMGGAQRILHTDARLGFHATSMPGLTRDELRADEAKDRSYFESKGVDRSFLDRAYSTPSSELWIPELKTLANAGVITHIYDGTQAIPVPK